MVNTLEKFALLENFRIMEQFLKDPSIYTLARGPLVWLVIYCVFYWNVLQNHIHVKNGKE